MKKVWKVAGSAVMCAAILAPVAVSFAGCGKSNVIDNETTPLVFSAQEFDEVFNPFYSTNAADSEIAGMTQISMLSADENGKVAYGDNEPVVVKDYTSVMYDKNGSVTQTGDKDGSTVYQFIIKKGIKFSDGKELTIKDVLFNLYTYLDPVYTGSSTIYSTDIQGLAAYRMQNPNMGDDASDEGFTELFNQQAQDRLKKLRQYLDKEYTPGSDEEKAQLDKDVKDFKAEIHSMLVTDWNACSELLESYVDEYDLQYKTEWEIFLILEGFLRAQVDSRGFAKKNAEGKYLLDYDSIDVNDFRGKGKDEIIENVYDSLTALESSVADVIEQGWSCTSTFFTTLVADQMSKYFDDLRKENNGALAVANVSGVKALKGSAFQGTNKYDDSYDMLQITINGIDPKAIWNFAFTVAPLHYYSGTYKGKNYVEAANPAANEFGVCFGDLNFYESILKSRNSVPMGAGVYKASTLRAAETNTTYNASTDFNTLKDGFYRDGIVYFERNTNFETLMGVNAKIKYVRYKVVSASNIMNALTAKSAQNQIHYADPSATTANISQVNKNANLANITVRTNGYGYIGLNAKKINDIYVRRAIMTTFNTDLVKSYYPEGYVDLITRPISLESWVTNAYEDAGIPALNATSAPAKYTYDKTFAAGRKILEDAGYEYDEAKNAWRDSNGKVCNFKYTFTIAGDSMDHPAYSTMYNASQILNANGFNITVKTSANALRDLAAGDLTCWAAAWSSTIDPDMYQVYHKNSKASSVKAWGYDYMIDEGKGSTEEKNIINNLSKAIDEGREYLDEVSRTRIYRRALDLVMDLAVEFPLYQRRDMYVYNKNVIDESTLNKNPSAYSGPISHIWELSLKETKPAK